MRKHLLLSAFLLFNLTVFALPVSNLLDGWSGNGDTNNSTSFPSNYGWDITEGDFNYANSTSGVRYIDVTTGHTLNSNNYSGRLLMTRWDGSGATTLNSVYSISVELTENSRYNFSWIYEWWNNASIPTLEVSISKDKDGTNPIASKTFQCADKNQLNDGTFGFFVVETGTYYVTIKQATNLAVLCAVGQLVLVKTEAVLESDVKSVALSYYSSEAMMVISPNGSADSIKISVPTGVAISSQTLAPSGGTVKVTSSDSSSVEGLIAIKQGADEVNVNISTSFPSDFFDLAKIDTLNVDGAWCWFNDPRALYYKGTKEQTYFGWINSVGDVLVASYNHVTGEYIEKTLFEKLEVDDHDNPAIFFRKDGRIIVYFSKHTSAPAHRFISTNPEDITSWGNDYQFGVNVTYPYPFQVNDKIYVFYRGINWHPTLVVSDDDGETLGEPQQFVTGGGGRPYARYCQDSTGAIHIAVTTGHPRQEATNKIYYACLKNGKFYRADGTFIKDYTGTATALDIDNNEAETVYNASNGKGWIWDITVDSANNPVMVYASFPTDLDHRYHYARWTGSEWFQTELTKGGKWFPQTPDGASEPEPNYSGGIILDYNNPSVVYLSKQVKGVFEIFKYTTADKGHNWKEQAITWDSPADIVNVRPVVPRQHKKGFFEVLWMRGKYRYYQDYHTSIVYRADSILNTLDSIALSATYLDLKVAVQAKLTVNYFPFITADKSIVWTSSNDDIVSVTNEGVVVAKSPGEAVVTALAVDGVEATCKVVVSEPNYLGDVFFDFGTPTSVIAAGALRVSESTLFTDSFGWSSTVASRDRGVASDELRDFNLSSSAVDFWALVRPGVYHITATFGDQGFAHDEMSVSVNDQLMVSGISNSAGAFTTKEFDVTISNSYLKFTFDDAGGTDVNWVLNSLSIKRVTGNSIENQSVVPFSITNVDMSVYDLKGRLILQHNVTGETCFDLLNRKMEKGIYIVQLLTPNSKSVFKYSVGD